MLKKLYQENRLFAVWLVFSIISIIGTLITHPILYDQIERGYNHITVSEIIVTKEFKGDTPESVNINFLLTYNGSNFTFLTNFTNNKYLEFNFSYESINDTFSWEHNPVYLKSGESKLLTISYTKDDDHFVELWNNNINTSNIHINPNSIPINFDMGSFMGILIIIFTFGSITVLAAFFGLVIVGIIMIIVKGYKFLPWPVKLAIDVVAFPFVVFFGARVMGTDDASNPNNFVINQSGEKIGIWDKKDRVVRDGSGKIIFPGNKSNKNNK